MIKLKFYFIINNQEWYWVKEFHSNKNVDELAYDYLTTKFKDRDPFEGVTVNDVKWKKV